MMFLTMEEKMSRIDVREDSGNFTILVNFIQAGVILHNVQFANQEAKKIKKDHYPKAELHLAKMNNSLNQQK